MFKFITFITVSVLCISAFGFDHSHSKWNSILKSSVNLISGPSSQFQYKELITNTSLLDQYLNELSSVGAAEFATWNQNQKLAFLYNAYNAFTVKLIVTELKKNPDLKSIREIGGLFKSPWKIKFFQFLGEESHLDRIEHDLTRPKFDEPRSHMAFNCASIGCPALRSEAFVADKLNAQLESSTRDFMADQSRNFFDAPKKSVKISMIFKWFKKDFEDSKTKGPLTKFIADYMPLTPEAKKGLLEGTISIKHNDYDWKLNAER